MTACAGGEPASLSRRICNIAERPRESDAVYQWKEGSCRPRLTLGVLEVVPPQGTDLVLATHVPHSKADVLVLHSFYIES